MTCRARTDLAHLCSADILRKVLSRLDGKHVTLMGLGLFGGGEGAARFLAEAGARVLITDLRSEEKLRPVMERLRGLSIDYRLGEHVETDFTTPDLVVANPAVPRTSAYLRSAQQAGVPITSPMNIFLMLCPAPVAAVTGSNGKSTTTSLLMRMAGCAGRRTWLGGNIGLSLLPSLSSIRPDHLVVLELSSFQLEDAESIRWSPNVAVITNVTPNHLDRHGTFDSYANAKRVMLKYQRPGDVVVLNAGDETLRRWSQSTPSGRVLYFDSCPEPGRLAPGVSMVGDRFVWSEGRRRELLCSRNELPLLGRHNAENAMAAATAARWLGAGQEDIRAALKRFVGLEHRLELVGGYDGLSFYNDSDSTTPESGIAALESFGGPVTLIAGGSDKKLDLRPLARAAAGSAEVLITMGNTGPRLAQMAREESAYAGRSMVVEEVNSLEEAMVGVRRLAMPGSAVVFSPSCPSYDMFDNFRHRGEVFKALVREHFGGGACKSRSA